MVLRNARTGFWHLRRGGLPQVRKWYERSRVERRTAGPVSNVRPPRFKPIDMPEYVPLDRARPFGHLRVGVILDDFSLRAWGYEFTVVELSPDDWQAQLREPIDLLLVESAWAGNHGKWSFQLTGPAAPSNALKRLVAFCRESAIPTVFWNKEDPPHFGDFLETARIFDVVFTSDVNLVERYQRELGHDRVAPMGFAAQPAIHNPVRIPGLHQRGDVAFAGTYFAERYPQRRAQMNILLGAASDISERSKAGLTIYSRFAEGDARYQFPPPYDKYVVGALDYDRMLTAYRAFKVFLNVNSVVDSRSMCARRIFEITACGTPVVSTESAAIPIYFAQDEVPVVRTQEEAGWTIRALVNSSQLRDRATHRAQRRIWTTHTYSHRALQVLEAAGVPIATNPVATPSVSIVCSTNRPEQMGHLLGQVAAQRQVEVQLTLALHGFEMDVKKLTARARELGIADVKVILGPADWTLGDCLNRLVGAADGDYVAKFDDDDDYGANYLLDQINAVRYSGADLVGKQASYLYLEGPGLLVLRNPEREHRWTTFVAGPTMVGPRETFRGVPFASVRRGEDTRLLGELTSAGAKIYSSDRFNFVQRRGGQGHTWQIDDAELLANGIVETVGLNPAHVMVD